MSARRLIAVLLAINVGLVLAGWLAVGAPPQAGSGFRVGLVFDVGGKNDESFNESAWRGLERARDELGIEVEYIEPTEGSDRESALRSLASRGLDLVIGVGFIFSHDLEVLAKKFPNVKFAGVDYSASDGVGDFPNLAGLRFREHEGSFVVGAIAGLLTESKIVGFVGGMKIPLIKKFEVGYAAGVAHVCPTCRVVPAYAGSEPKAFADPTTGLHLASAQYRDGADIIYHAAGKTGDGVFAAARQRKKRAIGVDADQFASAPCCIVTSMIKRVDLAILEVVKDVIGKRFRGGIHERGLGDDGVGFVADERNRHLLPPAVLTRANRIAEDIIAGKIRVPDR